MTIEKFDFLIDPDEAVFLARHAPFLSMATTAEAIDEKTRQDYQKSHQKINKKTLQLLALQAVFNAGRVYGIREERNKKKRGNAHEDTDHM